MNKGIVYDRSDHERAMSIAQALMKASPSDCMIWVYTSAGKAKLPNNGCDHIETQAGSDLENPNFTFLHATNRSQWKNKLAIGANNKPWVLILYSGGTVSNEIVNELIPFCHTGIRGIASLNSVTKNGISPGSARRILEAIQNVTAPSAIPQAIDLNQILNPSTPEYIVALSLLCQAYLALQMIKCSQPIGIDIGSLSDVRDLVLCLAKLGITSSSDACTEVSTPEFWRSVFQTSEKESTMNAIQREWCAIMKDCFPADEFHQLLQEIASEQSISVRTVASCYAKIVLFMKSNGNT